VFIRPVWVEVNLKNIEHNFKEIKKLLQDDIRVMACVKGNGYGHGAASIAKVALEAGATYLAVASADEAIELRNEGISSPVLVFGHTPKSLVDTVVEHDLTQTVFQDDMLLSLSESATKKGKTVNVHIKVDTGLGRIGIKNVEEALTFIKRAIKLPGIRVEGLYSQFATADELCSKYAEEQIKRWNMIINKCREEKLDIPLLHISNSAGIFQYSACGGNMVRMGVSMYGYYPYTEVKTKVNLRPALRFLSKITHLKKVPSGTKIGYGSTFETQRDSIIATVAVGYGDGYPRSLSNRGELLVHGVRVPTIGRVCMDQLMIDVTDVDGIRQGDEVELYGGYGENSISLEEFAQNIGTIPNEVLCWISKRVPRCYISDSVNEKNSIVEFVSTV
jgi:alanine racemase